MAQGSKAMDRTTLKDEMLKTLFTLTILSPALVAGGYWLVTGRSILSLLGW